MPPVIVPPAPSRVWAFPLCPAPPAWSLDWERAEAACGWLRAMAGVPQDPEYHAEGDVLIHTRKVAEALVGLPEWRGLPEEERHVLFAAALLHDVAKPLCTRVEPDGRITAPNHARRGARLARLALWMRDGFAVAPALASRESIAKLVRYHGLPLWFLESPAPERAVIEASQTIRLDRVALLAEADALGRECRDQAELLERLALFRAFCRENQCYDAPRPFPSPHSRFRYFRQRHADPDYPHHDDTEAEVVLMSGLPAAGKNTWIRQQLPHWPVVSLDQIRAELKVDPAGDQAKVIAAAEERAREYLRLHQPFVWNATNVTRMIRDRLIDRFASYRARVRIVYVDAPLELILDRNRHRPRRVPERVIHELMARLEMPDLTEAHEVTWIDNSDRLPSGRAS